MVRVYTNDRLTPQLAVMLYRYQLRFPSHFSDVILHQVDWVETIDYRFFEGKGVVLWEIDQHQPANQQAV